MIKWIQNIVRRSLGLNSFGGMGLFGGPTLSGAVVTESSALTISAVWAATRVISESLASLPLELFRHLPDGGREKATEHPLYNLVKHEPNPECTSFTLRESAQTHLLINGNAYLEIVRDGAGRPQSLWLVPPSSVYVRRADNTQQIVYSVDQAELAPTDVVHVVGLGWDGLTGLSPVSLARQSFGQMIAQGQYAAALLGNQARPSGLLSYPGQLTDEARANLERSFNSLYGGSTNAGKVAVLEEGLTFTPVSFSPADMDFMAQANFSVEEVARWFNISPNFIHSTGDRVTWGNLEQLFIQLVTLTLRPWMIKWEQELNRKLLTKDERETYYFEHNADALLRGDSQARMNYYINGIQWGILNPNECRSKENLNSYEGGDQYILPSNWIDATKLGQQAQVAASTVNMPSNRPVGPTGGGKK